jgi:hypothetical protein
MLAWFGELTAKERLTMGACFGGWALDAFDVQMYSFVIRPSSCCGGCHAARPG